MKSSAAATAATSLFATGEPGRERGRSHWFIFHNLRANCYKNVSATLLVLKSRIFFNSGVNEEAIFKKQSWEHPIFVKKPKNQYKRAIAFFKYFK